MNIFRGSAWGVVALLALSGCHRAESPEKVQADVAKASESAAERDAKAEQKLESANDRADRDMSAAAQKADERTIDAASSALITQAEGDHKVALAQCESLSGDAQRDCRKRADSELDAAKAKIKGLKSGQP